MPDNRNYLIGYGERLIEKIPPPGRDVPKREPYTFEQAKARLVPRFRSAAIQMQALPEAACPRNQTVALLTLHPTYTAKSYFPDHLLEAMGVEAVGSRAKRIKPEKTTRKREVDETLTTELFVAGSRYQFQDLASSLEYWDPEDYGAKEIVKIEDFSSVALAERVKTHEWSSEEPLLEVVLHAHEGPESAFVVEGFEAYLESLDIVPHMDRRFYAEGLCFMAVRVPCARIEEVAKYSFLRLAREMPRLRPFRPSLRSFANFDFPCQLPQGGPVDTEVRVAVFDGGLPEGHGLDQWVTYIEASDLSDAVPDYTWHGLAVTSALLFGPLLSGRVPDRPYSYVDHHRVLDRDTEDDDRLYVALARIKSVLENEDYDFVNLSLGPDLPVDDDDVDAWTAVLDQLLSTGSPLASIAVGNSGELDRASGNARIQTPADCVNGFSIGACTSLNATWDRASYSSIGPGRRPGVVKPDALCFGGTLNEPYWVLDGHRMGYAKPETGTSFASPTALRTGIGVRAHFGRILTPLAIKALLIHGCEDLERENKPEYGWGRIPTDISEIVATEDHTAHIIYQGTLVAGEWRRVPVPMPSEQPGGQVFIGATLCYTTTTDPQDTVNYTRSGLEVRFRPHEDLRRDDGQANATSKPFFQAKDFQVGVKEYRADAHWWETTLRSWKNFRGASLKNPVFDIHYNARSGGRPSPNAAEIPYALVITVRAPKVADLYNRIVTRYRTILEPLRPQVEIPVSAGRV